MSEIGENLKNIVMKGIEVIGNKANILASSAKQKVGEFNLTNEQKDLFCEIGSKVFELSRQGVEFPGELQADLQKAAEISEELERIHAEKETDQAAEISLPFCPFFRLFHRIRGWSPLRGARFVMKFMIRFRFHRTSLQLCSLYKKVFHYIIPHFS